MHFVFPTEDDFHIVLLVSITLLCKYFCFLVDYVDCKNDGQIIVFSILLTRTIEILFQVFVLSFVYERTLSDLHCLEKIWISCEFIKLPFYIFILKCWLYFKNQIVGPNHLTSTNVWLMSFPTQLERTPSCLNPSHRPFLVGKKKRITAWWISSFTNEFKLGFNS